MSDGGTRPTLEGLVPVPTYRDHPAARAADLSGVDLSGQPTTVGVLGTRRWTLLLFLSSACEGCRDLWRALGDPVGSGLATDESLVAVTRDLDGEDADELRRLAVPSVPTVSSPAAWRDYRVQGPPFFVLVDGTEDRVVTEGVAWGAGQVGDHLRRARQGSGGPDVPRLVPPDAGAG